MLLKSSIGLATKPWPVLLDHYNQLMEAHKGSKFRRLDFYLESNSHNQELGIAIDLVSREAIEASIFLVDEITHLTGFPLISNSSYREKFYDKYK